MKKVRKKRKMRTLKRWQDWVFRLNLDNYTIAGNPKKKFKKAIAPADSTRMGYLVFVFSLGIRSLFLTSLL
jgi:hypothetical protein